MGLRNLFDQRRKRLEMERKQEKGKMGSTYAKSKRYHHVVKCSVGKKPRPQKKTKIDSGATERMLNHSTNFQLFRLTRLRDTSKQSKELRPQKRVWLNKTISNQDLPDVHVITNMTLINCTLESCKLSKCQLIGCLVTNCKAVDSQLSDSLISWHHLKKYEEWFFENCKFSNCILANALVKNSELDRCNIDLAGTYFRRDSRLCNPGSFIRRSYLQVCTLRSCSISRAILADSKVSEACTLEFVTIARCHLLGNSVIRQSTAIESTAIRCKLLKATIQHCALSRNRFSCCTIRQQGSILHHLPPEIRIRIYRYSIDHFPPSIYLGKKHDSELKNLIAALRGDQELYQEAIEVRDRYVCFEYMAEYQGRYQGCSFPLDPLPAKAWRSLQRLTLQVGLEEWHDGRHQIPEILRRTDTLKSLSLEIQDFGWLDSRRVWETISYLSDLSSLARLSIMFYPKLDDIRMASEFRRLVIGWLFAASVRGPPGVRRGMKWIRGGKLEPTTMPWEIRQYIPLLDRVFGVKSYTDGLPGVDGCSWIWQARRGRTLKMGPLPIDV